jgi:hypothetical protein
MARENGHDLGPWEQHHPDDHPDHWMAYCNDCGSDATIGMNEGRPYTVGGAPHRPCEAEGREHATEYATEAAQMHLENDSGSYHDIHAIVNNSRHPTETSHLLGSYIRSLPSDHPLHQELRDHRWSADDIDTDDWARQLHAERDLQGGEPVGRHDSDYRQLLGRRRTAQGTPMLPGGQGTPGETPPDMNTPNLPGAGPGDTPAPQMNDPAAGTPLSAPIQQGPMGLNPNQVTTKPRQMPGAGAPMGGAPGAPMDFPPDINGANLPDSTGFGANEGATGGDPTAGYPDTSGMGGMGGAGAPAGGAVPTGGNNLAQATALIRRANPSLSRSVVARLARKASRYLAVVPPVRPEGTGEPLAPVRPARPADRTPEAAQPPVYSPKAPKPEWYQRSGDPQHELANAPVEDKNTLFQQRGR